MSDLTVRVDGMWLDDLAYVGPSQIVTRWPVGCFDAKWSLDLPANATPAVLRRGAPVEIYCGAAVVWRGVIHDAVRGEPWEITARGLGRLGEDYLALGIQNDADGPPTTSPQAVVTAAVGRGLPWDISWVTDWPAAVSGKSETVGFNSVAAVLTAACTAAGKRWGVFADGRLVIQPDPTNPRYVATPSEALSMGTSGDGYVSDMYGRFVSAETGSPAQASAWGMVRQGSDDARTRWGRVEKGVDLTNLGLMSGALAAEIVQGHLDSDSPRLAFTSGLDLADWQIASIGDVVPHPATVGAAGPEAIRVLNVLDVAGSLAAAQAGDVAIGEVSYTAGSGAIRVNPVGLEADDFTARQEELVRLANAEREWKVVNG